MTKHQEKPTVRPKRSGYQPTKAEMERDVSIDATPEAVARAVLTPVKIEYEKEESRISEPVVRPQVKIFSKE